MNIPIYLLPSILLLALALLPPFFEALTTIEGKLWGVSLDGETRIIPR